MILHFLEVEKKNVFICHLTLKQINKKEGQTMKDFGKYEAGRVRVKLDAEHAERVRARALKQRRKLQDQLAYELQEYERGINL